MYRFAIPPNWPPAPPGWTPPLGWRPPADWGPPPEGWVLWVVEPAQNELESARNETDTTVSLTLRERLAEAKSVAMHDARLTSLAARVRAVARDERTARVVTAAASVAATAAVAEYLSRRSASSANDSAVQGPSASIESDDPSNAELDEFDPELAESIRQMHRQARRVASSVPTSDPDPPSNPYWDLRNSLDDNNRGLTNIISNIRA